MNERLVTWVESIALIFVILVFAGFALRGLAAVFLGLCYLVNGVLEA